MWPSSDSNGGEPHVFNVDKLQDLLGVHAELMEETVRRDEALLYLLYSPVYREKKAPFDLQGTPSSHAVAVTSNRLIISEDQHRKGIVPTVQSIPFNQVLYVELGSAPPLGWFSVESAVDDKPSCVTLFFPAETGMKHFGTAVRRYRGVVGPYYHPLPAEAIEWPEVWRSAPRTMTDHLEPLVLPGELAFNLLRSSERWMTRKTRRRTIPACLSTNGFLLSTNFGFIHTTEDQPGDRPARLAVKVSCIPVSSVRSARIIEKRMYGNRVLALKHEMTRGGVTIEFDMPFDDSSLTDAEALVYFLTKNMGGG